jgi:hypothetical protein
MGDRFYGFSKDGVQKIKATVHAVSRKPKAPDAAAPWQPPGGGLLFVKTPVGGIAAGATSSASCTMTSVNTSTGAVGDLSDTVTVFNHPGTATVAGSKYITVGWVQGVWRPIVEAC